MVQRHAGEPAAAGEDEPVIIALNRTLDVLGWFLIGAGVYGFIAFR